MASDRELPSFLLPVLGRKTALQTGEGSSAPSLPGDALKPCLQEEVLGKGQWQGLWGVPSIGMHSAQGGILCPAAQGSCLLSSCLLQGLVVCC